VNRVDTPAVAAKRSHRRLWYIVASIALAFVALAGSCAFAISRLDFGNLNFGPLDLNATPGVYTPIPVPRSACRYLRRVHDTADRSGQLWVSAAFGSLADRKRNLVTFRLLEFDFALQRAMPHVPVAVRRQLHETLVQVRAGERELRRAKSVSAYGIATFDAVDAGNRSLGNASDLVGHACGFRLEPRLDFGRLMAPT